MTRADHPQKSSLQQQASQGDLDALTLLIQQQLQPQGVTVLIKAQEERLDVLLVGRRLTPPAASVYQPYVIRGIQSIRPAGIQHLRVAGKAKRQDAPGWVHEATIANPRPGRPYRSGLKSSTLGEAQGQSKVESPQATSPHPPALSNNTEISTAKPSSSQPSSSQKSKGQQPEAQPTDSQTDTALPPLLPVNSASTPPSQSDRRGEGDPSPHQWFQIQAILPRRVRKSTFFTGVAYAIALLLLLIAPRVFTALLIYTFVLNLFRLTKQPEIRTKWYKFLDRFSHFAKTYQLEIGVAILSLYCLLTYRVYRIPSLPYFALGGSVLAVLKAIYLGVSRRWRSRRWTLNSLLMVVNGHLLLASYLGTLLSSSQDILAILVVPILLSSLGATMCLGYRYKLIAISAIGPLVTCFAFLIFFFSSELWEPPVGAGTWQWTWDWRPITLPIYGVIGAIIYSLISGIPAGLALLLPWENEEPSGIACSFAMIGPYISVFATLPSLTFNLLPFYIPMS